MTSDKPTNLHDEDPPSRVFDETRPSMLANSAPTPESETLAPDAEPEPVTIEPTEPQVSFETATFATDTSTEPAPTTEPQIDAPTAIVPPDDSAPETDAGVEAAPIEPQTVAPIPAPIAPELLKEFAATQQPANAEPTAPTAPAENPALSLRFEPAPDAPFQSSVTIGVRYDAPNARVFYTLDGTLPDQTSTPYTAEKILLTESTTLSARAFASESVGAVQSADYIVKKPLWQELEPADQSDQTEHKASRNWSAPDGWQSGAASVRGKLHAHRALWREDAFALGDVGDWSIAIVSDGAGSAPLSRVGSRVACEAALNSLQTSLGALETLSDEANALQQTDLPRVREALMRAATDALDAIRAQADERARPLSAFAATLLILVRRAWNEAQLCASLQVGDGAIALDCGSGLKMLGDADHGQHSSETRFLTTGGIEASLASRVKFSLPADLRATLVVSDGVSDDYFPEDKRLIEVFDAVMPLAQNADDAGAALLEWLGYEKKGSSDDRTLVLSWPGTAIGEVGSTDADSVEIAAVSGEMEEAGLPPSSNRDDGETGEAKAMSGSEKEATAMAAGLTPPSNLEAEPQTRLEEGGSPAPSEPPTTNAIPAESPESTEPTDGS